MKITFVLKHANLSGGVRVVAIHAEALARRGHEVLVVSTPLPRPRIRSVVKSLALQGRLPPFSRTGPSHLDGAGVRHKLLDRDRPVTDADVPDADVVIATWWETAEWVARLSPSKGAKCSFLQHFEVHDPATSNRVEATWRLPFHKIVISRWLKDIARERFADTSVSLVPNSVDTKLFFAEPRERGNPPNVGFLYSHIGFKRSDVALAAFAKLRERAPNVGFVSFGSERVADPRFPEDGEFYLRPPQERLREIYSRCDAWLCTSDREGFALPLLEAMACRTPVVSTRSGGPQDFIEDGLNGYLVDEGDIGGLADRLHTLLDCEPSKWKAMSSAAYAAATRFGWGRAQDLFEKALLVAVDRARRSKIAGSRL